MFINGFYKKKIVNLDVLVLAGAVKHASPRCGVRLCSEGRPPLQLLGALGAKLLPPRLRSALLSSGGGAAVVDGALQPLPVRLFILKGTNVV